MFSGEKSKIMILTPSHDGRVHGEYATSLAETVSLLRGIGAQVIQHNVAASSLLVKVRNELLKSFWESDATHVLFVDGDLSWPAEAVVSLLRSNKDIAAGVYPARQEKKNTEQSVKFNFVPSLKDDKTFFTDQHFVKMDYIPAGFMLIKKEAVEKMIRKHPNLYCKSNKLFNEEHEDMFYFFDTEIYQDSFWGEDYVFCRRAREAGVEIWVDPNIPFLHDKTFGRLCDALHSSDKLYIKKDGKIEEIPNEFFKEIQEFNNLEEMI